jgi:hypothetical protein
MNGSLHQPLLYKKIFNIITTWFLIGSTMPSSADNDIQATKLLEKQLGAIGPFTTKLLAGGLSGSRVVRVDSPEKTYAVRFWNQQWIDYFPQDLECQLIASTAGYGPKVLFYDRNQAITVMEYLSPKGLPEKKIKLQALADLLNQIHSGPILPKGIDRSIYLDLLIEETEGSGFYNAETIRSIKNAVFSATRPNAECLPCHRDLHHGNLIYSENSFYSIDYTWGAMDDPFTDLANISIFNCETEEDEHLLLQLYFGRAPTALEMARLSLMKLPIKIFYGLEFLGVGAQNLPKGAIEHQVTPKSYMCFGSHDGTVVSPADFLNYAGAILEEVIIYSSSPQYAKDLEEVSTSSPKHSPVRFEFNNSALKFPNQN